jgi:TAG lipase/steryl ester hydrolase/phospholipase A2/LPA acyltransferase
VIAVITQEYTADINILPRYRFFDPRKLFAPLSEQDLMLLISEGQKATWPKLEMIRNCSRISQTLDEILYRFEHEALHRLTPSGKRHANQTSREPREIADEAVM